MNYPPDIPLQHRKVFRRLRHVVGTLDIASVADEILTDQISVAQRGALRDALRLRPEEQKDNLATLLWTAAAVTWPMLTVEERVNLIADGALAPGKRRSQLGNRRRPTPTSVARDWRIPHIVGKIGEELLNHLLQEIADELISVALG